MAHAITTLARARVAPMRPWVSGDGPSTSCTSAATGSSVGMRTKYDKPWNGTRMERKVAPKPAFCLIWSTITVFTAASQ